MAVIGYGKVGRALHFDPKRFGMQGDPAAPQVIRRLAERNPSHTFVVISKNDGLPDDYPTNVENLWPDGVPRASWKYDGPGIPLIPIPEGLAYEQDVIVPAVRDLDGVILDWGQHGTSHMFIPQTKFSWKEAQDSFEAVSCIHGPKCPCKYTHPHAWARQYGAAIIQGVNAFQDRHDGRGPTAHIVEDPRNFIKGRDLKWPTGTDDILSQNGLVKTQIHERFMDLRTPHELGFRAQAERGGELWRVNHTYRHGGTEMMILPSDWDGWGQESFDERVPAGIGTTAFWDGQPGERRAELVHSYYVRAFPDAAVYGKWDKKSLEAHPTDVQPMDAQDFHHYLGHWRVTMCLPSISRMKGGGTWCTGKPWQAFAAGAVCFHAPSNDAQGWIIPSRVRTPGSREVSRGLFSVRSDWTPDELVLAEWLRTSSPEDFAHKARIVAEDRTTYEGLAATQRSLLRRRWDEHYVEARIEERLCLTQ